MADKAAERIRYQSEVLRNLLILTTAAAHGQPVHTLYALLHILVKRRK